MDEKNLFIVTLLQKILDLPQLLVVGLFTVNNFLNLIQNELQSKCVTVLACTSCTHDDETT